jgi:replicative DNA helicase
MPSLRQAARVRGSAGEQIPDVFPTLAALEVQLWRGSMHVLASAPGGGKSVFATTTALRSKVPTLYLVCDDNETRTLTRVIQAAQQIDKHSAREALETGGLLAREVLDTIDWVRFDFPSSPSMEEIRDRVWAFGEIYGEFPHLIVIDNLMDVVEDQSSASYSEAEQALAGLARAANAAVLVLAHVTGSYESGHDIIPMSGLMFKPSKKAALVLSMAMGGHENELFVSVLKNRDGPRDPAGVMVRAKLLVDYSRMQAN